MNVSFVFASAFLGIAIIATLFRIDAGGAVPAAAVMLPGLVLMAEQEMGALSEVPWQAYPLAGLAPLILAEALPFNHWRGFFVHVIRFVLLAIPLAAAVWLALYAGPLGDL